MADQGKIITKMDFIKEISNELHITQADASKYWNSISGLIGKIMKENDELRITGFGSFKAKDVPARKESSPRDGSMIDVPAQRQVRFSVGSDLKKDVNSK